MSEYKCDTGGKTPGAVLAQYRDRCKRVRNKPPYYNFATCPSCGKLIKITDGKINEHNRN